MAYRVEFVPTARKALRNLDAIAQRRLVEALVALEANPRPPQSKKLAGRSDLWRLRVGDYRVVYRIEDRCLLVLIVALGHRREIYRDF